MDDKWFNAIVMVIIVTISLIIIIPLLFVVSVSLTPMGEVLKNGGYIFLPRSVTFSAYREILGRSEIWSAYRVTFLITVIGTAINLLLTVLSAYPLSRKTLPYRPFFLLLVVFTLLFNGGLIPTYLVVKNAGLLNSIWAMIVPNAISAFNLLLMKSFFQSLPDELFEQARIDGAGETRILAQLVIPISKPVTMTIGLFYMVGHWNEFFQAVFYVSNKSLFPLQVLIQELLTASQSTVNVDVTTPTMSLQMAAVICVVTPILIVYPFVQRFFVQGVIVGSIKG
jgi:putative aldouronate transport system permease protein